MGWKNRHEDHRLASGGLRTMIDGVSHIHTNNGFFFLAHYLILHFHIQKKFSGGLEYAET